MKICVFVAFLNVMSLFSQWNAQFHISLSIFSWTYEISAFETSIFDFSSIINNISSIIHNISIHSMPFFHYFINGIAIFPVLLWWKVAKFFCMNRCLSWILFNRAWDIISMCAVNSVLKSQIYIWFSAIMHQGSKWEKNTFECVYVAYCLVEHCHLTDALH